jgi:hypothetical protein
MKIFPPILAALALAWAFGAAAQTTTTDKPTSYQDQVGRTQAADGVNLVGRDSGDGHVCLVGGSDANCQILVGATISTAGLALETGGNLASTATNTGTTASELGAVTASPTAYTIGDRLKTINSTLGSPFQAGGSIGNTAFGISGNLPDTAGGSLAAIATAQGAGGTGITQPTGGSGVLGWLSGIFKAVVGLPIAPGTATGSNTFVWVGCQTLTALPSYTTAQLNGLDCEPDGDLRVTLPDYNNTAGTGLNVTTNASTTGGANTKRIQVANNTTSIAVCTAACTLYGGYVQNNSATIAYVKTYNTAQESTTCGSGTVIDEFMIPASTSGAGALIQIGGSVGAAYSTALSVCITTGYADNDTTAPAASAYVVSLYTK